MKMTSRNITDSPKPKPSEALNTAAENNDIICSTPIEWREVHIKFKKVEEKSRKDILS